MVKTNLAQLAGWAQIVVSLGRIEDSGIQLLGTGFAVGRHKVVTAQHVIGMNDDGLAIIKPHAESLLDYQDTSNTKVQYSKANLVAVDPIHDLCILEIPETSFLISFDLSSSDEIPPGSTVTALGFPHADHGRMVLTQHTTQVGARVLIKSHGQLAKHIILNTQAREGQSGGPVLDENGKVAAILIGSYAPSGGGGISLGGVDPTTLHQTTHAVSAEYLRGMLS